MIFQTKKHIFPSCCLSCENLQHLVIIIITEWWINALTNREMRYKLSVMQSVALLQLNDKQVLNNNCLVILEY